MQILQDSDHPLSNHSLVVQASRVLDSALGSHFMEWKRGSTLFFWRWHPNLFSTAIEGIKPHIVAPLPNNKRGARRPKEPAFSAIYSKIKKYITRGYLRLRPRATIVNFIDYFAVPKGDEDIRVVFNGSSCGLNDSLWSQNFWLPTSKSLVRSVGYNYKFVDMDLGEMFLNFPLHRSLVSHSGVDLTPFRNELISDRMISKFAPKRVSAVWTRTWMGLKTSPLQAVQFYYFAEEFIRGDHQQSNNPLRWDDILFNLPGNPNFNPSLPFVMKWNRDHNQIAGELIAYVDDLRGMGWSTEHAWQIARWVAARLQFLGIQDAGRKRRVDHGPWAGTIFLTDKHQIQRTVQVSKWEKAKSYLVSIRRVLEETEDPLLNYKLLERVRGFMCHLAMTYEILFPYLKGFHLTLSSYLPNRGEDGWTLADDLWNSYVEDQLHIGALSDSEAEAMKRGIAESAPEWIKPVPLFYQCLDTLEKFFSLPTPPRVTDRSNKYSLILYGFGDASKSGFGSMIDDGDNLRYRIGLWGWDSEENSSNWREFENLVTTVEEEAKLGKLSDSHLIMATDNSTVEGCFYKGNSKSPKLYELVVRMRQVELEHNMKIYITHVPGTRMKAQGTDGLSRGNCYEGVSFGESMLKYCPWGIDAFSRSTALKEWIDEWFLSGEHLTPKDWYIRGHDHCGGYFDDYGFWRWHIKKGNFIWSPPPAAADVAIEELRKARIKRQESTHVIVIPKLFTHLWKKQCLKVCDLVIDIPAGHTFWPSNQYEDLTVGFCFPFLPFRPWQLRSTPKMFAYHRKMRQMFKDPQVDGRDILFQLLMEVRRWASMPERVVWKVLHFSN